MFFFFVCLGLALLLNIPAGCAGCKNLVRANIFFRAQLFSSQGRVLKDALFFGFLVLGLVMDGMGIRSMFCFFVFCFVLFVRGICLKSLRKADFFGISI